jgi:hypothetical protein
LRGTCVSVGKAGVFAGAPDLPSMLKILKDFQCVAGRGMGGWPFLRQGKRAQSENPR